MAEISLPVFEGPLDLLLHLIERDDLDITAVSLVSVTDQYLKAIRNGDGFEAHALAEFVSVGAKLIYLKSRALLPRPRRTQPTRSMMTSSAASWWTFSASTSGTPKW